VAAGVVDIIDGTHVVNLWKVVIELGPSFLQIDTRIWGLMVLTSEKNRWSFGSLKTFPLEVIDNETFYSSKCVRGRRCEDGNW